MSSTDEIAAKWQEVKGAGLDLGAATGPEGDAGFGGRVQVYEHGRIYWHPSVGTHELHGAILAKYLLLGGATEHPVSGLRAFGFPTSDEHSTPDGVARVSEFEWGSIHWGYGAGAVPLYGPTHLDWSADYVRSSVELGMPLTEPFTLPGGGEAAFFTNGFSFTPGPGTAVSRGIYRGPMLGNPEIVTPGTRDLASFSVASPGALARPGILSEICDSRLVLQRVDDPSALLPLVAEAAGAAPPPPPDPGLVLEMPATGPVVRDHRGAPGPRLAAPPTSHRQPVEVHDHRDGAGGDHVELIVRLAPGAQLQDRSLYNIAVRAAPDGTIAAIGVHAVYARETWDDFGVAHVTDIHVAERADYVYRRLRELGRDVSADVYNNPNEDFRDFIRYANHLHRLGLIDVVLATGDLVDYQYEGEEVPANKLGGNFHLFEKLVRGQSGSVLGTPVEELHVPLFTTLGNHDYRKTAYGLYFEIEIPVKHNPVVESYEGFNLARADVNAMQGLSRPDLSSDAAAKFVQTDRPGHYFARINTTVVDEGSSYLVRLGPSHRLVVLDSKHDIGVVDGDWEAFKVGFIGVGGEDKYSFLDGAPNQVGVSDAHLALLSQALSEAGGEGTVITGIHGPPINIKGGEFAPYFRETEHPSAHARDVIGFLLRQAPESFASQSWAARGQVSWDDAERIAGVTHPGWMNINRMRFFMSGGVDDLLDRDVSKGRMDDFLMLCSGTAIQGFAAPRPVDVVLCGHGHNRVEYRIEWDLGSKRMRYFTDFYTENPAVYYPTKKGSFRAGDDRINVVVEPGAAPNGTPQVTAHHDDGDEYTVSIPPYADALSAADDKAGWWNRHRPLIMETAALGPRSGGSNDRSDPGKRKPNHNFQGFRVLSVSGPTVSAIRYVEMDELRAKGFRMPWETTGGAGAARDPTAPAGRVD